jgi:hypothetical protein
MKINIHFLKLLAVFLMISSVFNVKIKAPVSEYSRTETPEVMRAMFKIIKKANKEDSQMFDECMKVMLAAKYETAMKAFWESITNISCKLRDDVKKEFFSNFVGNTQETMNVDNVKEDCKAVVLRNFIPDSEISSVEIQRKLRDQFTVFFDCPSTAGKNKNLITAFLGPHKGNEENKKMYHVLNGNK